MPRRLVWVGLTLSEQTVSHHLCGSRIVCQRDLKHCLGNLDCGKHSSDSQSAGKQEERAHHPASSPCWSNGLYGLQAIIIAVRKQVVASEIVENDLNGREERRMEEVLINV